jgi:hypothetical protein
MNQGLDIEIDALTESVVEVSTGKIFKLTYQQHQ